MYKSDFDGILVTLASMNDVDEWSHGVVDNPDTVNYRTWKPKQGWLFCEAIFGPIKNYECSCGKYKWVRYKGIVCERCGVEVTTSRVRRSRMWHVELASPVVHVWYKSNPSGGIHQLLQMSSNEVDKILSFVKYAVLSDVSKKDKDSMLEEIETIFESKTKEVEELYLKELDWAKKKQHQKEITKLYEENKDNLLKERNRIRSIVSGLWFWYTVLESDYRNILYKFEDKVEFVSWPEGIHKMLKAIDIKKMIKEKIREYSKIKSREQKKKTIALIKLLINLYVSGVKPENMVIKKLPVIPPDLRPVVQLDGGRFASSDVNLFYRRVLMRNIRLKKMIQVGMPDVVKKNEIRLLQESVNNLLVWEKGWAGKGWAGNKVFKSLSDMLSGKEWVFRKNLLGKRVDYSGRSIITVGPDLRLNECGLPIYIAMKMFTPFIIGKLIEKNIAYTPKQAEKMIKDWDPITLRLLEEVIKWKYVLLNRAPTLHRLSIEAFKIKLMPWKTIRIHPLVCPAFNADFDWDQMAVHLPISEEAQKEAREIIAADKNILIPATWEPTISHSQDMVLGIYYITDFFDPRYPDYNTEDEREEKAPLKWYYADFDSVIKTFKNGDLEIKDKIVLVFDNWTIVTNVWRVIFNNVLPEDIRFVNNLVKSKDLKKLLSVIFDEYDMATTVEVADNVKDIWFECSTLAANSINILDMKVPVEKKDILQDGDEKANKIFNAYHKWFLSLEEKHRLVTALWAWTKEKVEWHLKNIVSSGNDLYSMIDSWARWSQSHMTQISGMKWLVVDSKWRIIEIPIKGSFVEGLKPIEYFLSANAWRKWKADTALRTAESGYLTRKLCDSSQEVIVRTEDCGTDWFVVYSKEEYEVKWESFYEVITGRILVEDVTDANNNVVMKAGDLITKHNINLLEDPTIREVKIRNSLVCKTVSWVCQKCYGMDLSTREVVKIWVPVWIIAAQSIWEPATQLTLNTFHAGWVAQKNGDMAQGIDRIKQLLEVRAPKKPAVVSPFDGVVSFFSKGANQMIRIVSEYEKKTYVIKDEYEVCVKVWDIVKKGANYAKKWRWKNLKVQEEWTILEIKKDYIVLWIKEVVEKSLSGLDTHGITEWSEVYKGQILTTWALNIDEYKDIVWDLEAQRYIISEVKKVYAAQWQDINDRHIEVVVKQIFSKVFVETPGDTHFIPWTYVRYEEFLTTNQELENQWKSPAKWRRVPLWLVNIAKSTESWLSSASFQETIRVMVGASLKWSIDTLSDLKSNVIIGRLLPIGEVYRKDQGYE